MTLFAPLAVVRGCLPSRVRVRLRPFGLKSLMANLHGAGSKSKNITWCHEPNSCCYASLLGAPAANPGVTQAPILSVNDAKPQSPRLIPRPS